MALNELTDKQPPLAIGMNSVFFVSIGSSFTPVTFPVPSAKLELFGKMNPFVDSW